MPAKTVQEFVAYAKANPGKLNFGASLGTPPHLMGALFKHLAGLDILYIPYKGAAPSIADMMGGVTHMQFDALTTLYPLIADGKLRALAVTSATRWPALPDVPTMIESGFATFPQNAWSGVPAPAGTPASIVARLNAVINDGLKTQDAQAISTKLSALTQPGSPQDFAAFMADQAPEMGGARAHLRRQHRVGPAAPAHAPRSVRPSALAAVRNSRSSVASGRLRRRASSR